MSVLKKPLYHSAWLHNPSSHQVRRIWTVLLKRWTPEIADLAASTEQRPFERTSSNRKERLVTRPATSSETPCSVMPTLRTCNPSIALLSLKNDVKTPIPESVNSLPSRISQEILTPSARFSSSSMICV